MGQIVPQFPREPTEPIIKNTNRKFIHGLPPTQKTRISRELRRSYAWDKHTKNWSITDIALDMNLSPATVAAYIDDSIKILKPHLVKDTVDHVIDYIAQQEAVIKKAWERIAKIEDIEDLWVGQTFDKTKTAPEEEQEWWDAPPTEEEGQKVRKKYTPAGKDFSLKQESVAALLETIAKATTNIAKVKGLITNKVNVEVSVGMMSDEALLKALQDMKVDPALLGIGGVQEENTEPDIIKAVKADVDEDIIEGEFQDANEFIPNISSMESAWGKDGE